MLKHNFYQPSDIVDSHFLWRDDDGRSCYFRSRRRCCGMAVVVGVDVDNERTRGWGRRCCGGLWRRRRRRNGSRLCCCGLFLGFYWTRGLWWLLWCCNLTPVFFIAFLALPEALVAPGANSVKVPVRMVGIEVGRAEEAKVSSAVAGLETRISKDQSREVETGDRYHVVAPVAL